MAKDIKFYGLDDVMSDFEQMRDSDHYFSLFLACNPASGELYSMLVRPFESPALPAEYSIKLLTGQEMTRAQVIRYFTREIEAREAAKMDADHGHDTRGGVCMKIEYQCSSCGKRERVSAMVGIPHGMFALGYRAVGDALYCPDCVNSWAERNGKPFDEQYKDVGHMFAEWWNATVLKKAKAEHKKLKKYDVNEIGGYEDRGDVAE